MTALHEIAIAMIGLALMVLVWSLGYLAALVLIKALLVARDRFEDMICAIRRYLRRRKGLL